MLGRKAITFWAKNGYFCLCHTEMNTIRPFLNHILLSVRTGNQIHRAGDIFEEMGLLLHKVAYSRHDVTSETF
jgi:hypothetical protein